MKRCHMLLGWFHLSLRVPPLCSCCRSKQGKHQAARRPHVPSCPIPRCPAPWGSVPLTEGCLSGSRHFTAAPLQPESSPFYIWGNQALRSLSQTKRTELGNRATVARGQTPALTLTRAVNEGRSWESALMLCPPRLLPGRLPGVKVLEWSQDGLRSYCVWMGLWLKPGVCPNVRIIIVGGKAKRHAVLEQPFWLPASVAARLWRALGSCTYWRRVGSELPSASVSNRTSWSVWHTAALSHSAIWKQHTTWKWLESCEGKWSSKITRIFKIWNDSYFKITWRVFLVLEALKIYIFYLFFSVLSKRILYVWMNHHHLFMPVLSGTFWLF